MDRKLQNTAKQLQRQVDCAKQAGIYDSMFIAFGSLLGYVRHGGMIPGDDDLDVGFLTERITKEQEDEYIRLIGEPTKDFPEHGLFEARREITRRDDNGRLFWVSCRGLSVDSCFKCCHWFFWTQKGYAWHCKGRGAGVKGVPAGYLAIGPEIEFLGVKIHVPAMAGSLLDFWYTDWFTQRMGGNSARKVMMEVSDWGTMAGSVKFQHAK